MAKASIMKRQTAAAVPSGGDGVPTGKSERKTAGPNNTAASISTGTRQQQQPQPLLLGDENTSDKVILGPVKRATRAASASAVPPAAGKGASPLETKTGGGASTMPVGQGAEQSQASNTETGATAAAAAVPVADSPIAAGKPVGPADATVEREDTTATAGDKYSKKKNGGLSAAPETTAAEKV